MLSGLSVWKQVKTVASFDFVAVILRCDRSNEAIKLYCCFCAVLLSFNEIQSVTIQVKAVERTLPYKSINY